MLFGRGRGLGVSKPIVLHPLLFAILPVLFLYSHNVSEVVPGDLPAPLAAALVAAALLWWLLGVILRDRIKAGLVASLFWVWFFSFGHFYHLLPPASPQGFAIPWGVAFAVGYTALLAIGVVVLAQARRDTRTLSSTLNVAAVALVAWNAVAIGAFETRRALADRRAWQPAALGQTHSAHPAAPPNIYYIILDGYGRQDVLRDMYGFDNREFLDYLVRKGFRVARNARANYCQTTLSLASSLNLTYLDDATSGVTFARDLRPITDLLKTNRLSAFLHERGYRTCAFATGYWQGELRSADIYIDKISGMSGFYGLVFETTPLPALLALFSDRSKLSAAAVHAQRILYILDHLADTVKLKPPMFVFAHIIAPHPPFVFDRSGKIIASPTSFTLGDGTDFGGTREQYVASYKEQLLFVNREMRAVIDRILAGARRPTVIILQSDHGPGSRLDWKSVEKTDARERLANLIAYYFPGEKGAYTDDDISPVNLFRVVLNRYFGARLELLPNESYYSTWDEPYHYIRVTDKVKLNAGNAGAHPPG